MQLLQLLLPLFCVCKQHIILRQNGIQIPFVLYPLITAFNTSIAEPEQPVFESLEERHVTEEVIIIKWRAARSEGHTYDLTWHIASEGPGSSQTFTGINGLCKLIPQN